MKKTYEVSYIDDILSETDEAKRETIINDLKAHLVELENNNKFVDDLSRKFSALQNEFKNLSISKKQIEGDLTRKISSLQTDNEKLNNKYISAKEQIKTIISNHSEEINHLRNMNEITIKDNENLLKENKKLIKQIKELNANNDSTNNDIIFYQRQIDDANRSIMKLNSIIKNLEDKNEALTRTVLNKEKDNSKEVIIGLRKVIDEKEKMINNLYNSFDRLSIKYEEIVKKNEMYRNEIMTLKNHINVNEGVACSKSFTNIRTRNTSYSKSNRGKEEFIINSSEY